MIKRSVLAATLLLISGAAIAAPQSVTLNWTDAGAETSYQLQRQAAACTQINSNNWVVVSTLPADTTTYNDTVEGGASYCYRIAAQVGGVNQGWSNLHQIDVVDTIVTPVLSGSQD